MTDSDTGSVASARLTSPSDGGFLDSYKSVLLHPKAFFANLPLEGPIERPLKFLVYVVLVASLGNILGHGIMGYIAAVCGNFATEAVFVLALTYGSKLFEGAQDLTNMLRACCYASAPMVLHLLGPLGFAGSIYGLYLLFLGVQRTQRLDAKKSAMTVATACLAAIAVGAVYHIIFRAKHH